MPATPTSPPILLGIGEAASRLGLSVPTLRRYANSGKVPYLLTPGGQRRFRSEDIDSLLVSGAAS